MHVLPLRRLLSCLPPTASGVLGVRAMPPDSGKTRYFNSTTFLKSLPRNSGHWKWPTTNIRDPRVRGGSRMWYPPVNNKEDARNLALNLDPTGRKLLMDQLKIIEEKQDAGAVIIEPASNRELAKVFLVNCLPFIGFGFLDNSVMILAGEYIDIQLGLILGISTMAAAALGNLISDLAGVGTAGYIENMVEKFQSIQPNLVGPQFHMNSVRWATGFGRAIGITIGCLLGMLPLLFFDHGKEKKEDLSKKDKLIIVPSAPEVLIIQPVLVSSSSVTGGSQ